MDDTRVQCSRHSTVRHLEDLAVDSTHAKKKIAQPSRLLAQPAELRNAIWSLVLVSTKPIMIKDKSDLVCPPLLQVCQCITTEATMLYYSSNIFVLSIHPWALTIPGLWLGGTVGPANIALIKHLRIQLDGTTALRQAVKFMSEKYNDVRDELNQRARRNLHAFAKELMGRGVDLSSVSVTMDFDTSDRNPDPQQGWIRAFAQDMLEALHDASKYLVERQTGCSTITCE